MWEGRAVSPGAMCCSFPSCPEGRALVGNAQCYTNTPHVFVTNTPGASGRDSTVKTRAAALSENTTTALPGVTAGLIYLVLCVFLHWLTEKCTVGNEQGERLATTICIRTSQKYFLCTTGYQSLCKECCQAVSTVQAKRVCEIMEALFSQSFTYSTVWIHYFLLNMLRWIKVVVSN